MTYQHFTTRELTLIADFWHQGMKAYRAAKILKRGAFNVHRLPMNGKVLSQWLY